MKENKRGQATGAGEAEREKINSERKKGYDLTKLEQGGLFSGWFKVEFRGVPAVGGAKKKVEMMRQSFFELSSRVPSVCSANYLRPYDGNKIYSNLLNLNKYPFIRARSGVLRTRSLFCLCTPFFLFICFRVQINLAPSIPLASIPLCHEPNKCTLRWTLRHIKASANDGSSSNALSALFALTATLLGSSFLR